MEEPLETESLCGLTDREQRHHSHFPQEVYGQPHFMPSAEDGPEMAALNSARCAAREAELAAAEAFCRADGTVQRQDILRAMNRMSSMLYILMIRQKAKK
jgi:ethanolamine utilization cobalamin adenosyltransferase